MKKFCYAILSFKNTDKFVMCELEENHTSNHQALMFEWEKGTTEAHESYRLRGLNLLRMKAEKLLSEAHGK